MGNLNEKDFQALYAEKLNTTKAEADKRVNDFRDLVKFIAKEGKGLKLRGLGTLGIETVKGRKWSVNGKSGVSEDKLTLRFNISKKLYDEMNADLSEN